MSSMSTYKDGAWHGVIEQDGQFPPEKGRYHLYIGHFCPFAHRVNLILHIKNLTPLIPVSIVRPFPKGTPGWKFSSPDAPYEGSTVDHLFNSVFLHEVYFRDMKEYKGKYTVPMLWDTKNGQIVNNESLEILRNFNAAWNSALPDKYAKIDLYPEKLRGEIDEIGTWMQSDLNRGVYKAGFASDQETYNKNVVVVFRALNRLEQLVAKNGGPYILGSEMTELDLRLYPTLIRFDVAYVEHFLCNLGTIRHDYPVLNHWMKNLYWNVPGFKETTDFKHIKDGYYNNHGDINPKKIVPMGPLLDIESGVEKDWTTLRVGGVKLP